ncbi:alpha/beta hydrolase family protein [Dyadobacter sp. MSC1_007]|jgi:pimeloyl-ACP methyl ester carboxylesterase|uniref:alpha/beta hydrolase family protein n=1 Tax=Dyadobacter sp. MSC1_007 TaxID=2909264 RepID=UPI00202FD07A|nr:alpha/beta fold hydrolase [Dyadobacter sp. MSC1_007]
MSKKKISTFEVVAIVLSVALFAFIVNHAFVNMPTGAKRPQEPHPPFPYYRELVKFENSKAGVTLAGTLTLPALKGNFPAVVMISGSGPQNRDEEIYNHKIFHVIADHLTRNGIAVLRFDDRGVGESTGNFKTATSEDFSYDVESAVTYLKTRKEIKKDKIGLAGHSEGGLIAPMVAARSKDVAFLVLLAAPAMQLDSLLLLQQVVISRISGLPEAQIQKSRKINAGAYKIVTSSTDPGTLKAQLTAYVKENPDTTSLGRPKGMTHEQAVSASIDALSTPWARFILTYDPIATLQKVTCPILALNGEKDFQVPPKENLGGIKWAAKRSGNQKVKAIELPGLNHLFQECKTGSFVEYPMIEQTFSPLALKTMSNWIGETVR